MDKSPNQQPEAVGAKNSMTKAQLFRRRMELHFMSKVLTIQVLYHIIKAARSLLNTVGEQLVRQFPDMKDEVEKICSDA